jgi:putative ABC transport system substrate-binding protein
MLKRAILALSAVGVVLSATAPFAADPPPLGRVYRIGVLSDGTPKGLAREMEALRSGMADLGWNGTRIEFVERLADGRYEQLPRLAAELVALKVDVIVALGGLSVKAVMRATRQIPIVFPRGWDPGGEKLVTSLARPGGNATGLSLMAPDLYAKELSLLKEAMPELRRVGVVIDSAEPSAAGVVRALRATGETLGIELKMVEIQPLDSLDSRLNDMNRTGVQAITGFVDTYAAKDKFIRFGIANRVPLAGYTAGLPGLLSLEVDELQMVRRSAYYVDKILRGANPGELAVEQPTKFLLFINLATAKAFGLTIPQSLLIRATELVQ